MEEYWDISGGENRKGVFSRKRDTRDDERDLRKNIYWENYAAGNINEEISGCGGVSAGRKPSDGEV